MRDSGFGCQTEKGCTVSDYLKNSPLGIGCVVLIVAGMLSDPSFMTLFNFQNIIRSACILGTVAIGMTLVMLIKEIDLSVGSLMAFCPILAIDITVWVMSQLGVNAIQGGQYLVAGAGLFIALTLLIGLAAGLFNGFLVTRVKIQSLITTLGVLYAARALAYILSGGHSVYLTKLPGVKWIGAGDVLGIPTPMIIFLLLGFSGLFLMRKTTVGRYIYAIGGNETAAKYAGINTAAWKLGVFAFCGFCAALAALMYSSYLASTDPQQAFGYELSAIAIVVLGGTTMEGGLGGLGGTILAALMLGILNNIIELIGLRIWYQQVIVGCVIIAAIMPRYLRKKAV